MRGATFGLPDPNVAIVTDDKILTQPWYIGLIRLAQLSAERAIAPVSLGVSPFTYTATTIGDLLIRSGTVSAVTLVRGAVSVVCPTSGFIPMAAEDKVVITYSVLPIVTFVPRARA